MCACKHGRVLFKAAAVRVCRSGLSPQYRNVRAHTYYCDILSTSPKHASFKTPSYIFVCTEATHVCQTYG